MHLKRTKYEVIALKTVKFTLGHVMTDDNRNFKINYKVFNSCFSAPREKEEYSCLPYTVISTKVASLATYFHG